MEIYDKIFLLYCVGDCYNDVLLIVKYDIISNNGGLQYGIIIIVDIYFWKYL